MDEKNLITEHLTSSYNNMRNIYNKNTCVIGGAGFLGSHLVDYLLMSRECNVLVLDNLISGSKKHDSSVQIAILKWSFRIAIIKDFLKLILNYRLN